MSEYGDVHERADADSVVISCYDGNGPQVSP